MPELPVGSGDAVEALPEKAPAEGPNRSAQGLATADLPGRAGEALPSDIELAEAARPALRPAANGLLPIEFDLADPGAFGSGGGGSAIEIKAFRF